MSTIFKVLMQYFVIRSCIFIFNSIFHRVKDKIMIVFYL